MNIPEQLKYTKDHEWVKIEGEIATVGITDYAQGELGDIVFVELPDVGKVTDQGKPFGTIEAVKAVSDLFAPLSGEVIEINDALKETPELINKSPYETGWMIRMKMKSGDQVAALLDAAGYKKLIGG
ncbi:MAG: glycine cleavage system protein GcvH [Ignavibacteria bacterium]|nr:glycine cleavage system protein GcvH [Ignavibacteria bacterium]